MCNFSIQSAIAGAKFGYTFNQIFTDGNKFRDAASIDYNRESLGLGLGFAWSWQNYSLTFAINERNILQSSDTDEALEDLTQFGTLTYSWRSESTGALRDVGLEKMGIMA